jgi:hypothetical protein
LQAWLFVESERPAIRDVGVGNFADLGGAIGEEFNSLAGAVKILLVARSKKSWVGSETASPQRRPEEGILVISIPQAGAGIPGAANTRSRLRPAPIRAQSSAGRRSVSPKTGQLPSHGEQRYFFFVVLHHTPLFLATWIPATFSR